MSINLNKLYGWAPKLEEAIQEVDQQKFSHSVGQPIIVSRLDSPRGSFYVLDGYHRVIEAFRRGEGQISAQIDEHIPRVERTGGAYNFQLAQKVHIVSQLNGQ